MHLLDAPLDFRRFWLTNSGVVRDEVHAVVRDGHDVKVGARVVQRRVVQHSTVCCGS